MKSNRSRRETKTGGRNATTRHIAPKLALAVGMPQTSAPDHWSWSPLTELARMESGHTPSRRHPEYWDGDVPWIGIKDARENHGRTISRTLQNTNELGLANSSARLLPKDTVCLSRTASVGYVVVMGRPMATSQDFVNWVCSEQLDPRFLQYLLIAEGNDIVRFASGSVHQTIYFPEAKAFHICHPPLSEQRRIVGILDEAFDGIATAKANAEKNLQNARALFESYRESIFEQRGDDWIEKSLSELCDIKHGFAFKSQFFTDQGGYVLLTPGNFFESGGYRDRGEKQKYYVGEIPNGFILDKNDLLVAMTEQAAGLLGSPILVPEPNRFLHNQRLGLVQKKRGLSWTNEFFFHVFNSKKVRREIHNSASGVKVRHTSPKKMGVIRVAFPASTSEQIRISNQINHFHRKTLQLESTYRQKIGLLDNLRSSILLQAFSGSL